MIIQRRGGPQVVALFDRFGVKTGPQDVDLIDAVLPTAAVPRLDNLCGGGEDVAADVGNRSLLQLFNPVDSGVVVIVHRLWISLTVAGTAGIRMHNTALATAGSSLDVFNRVVGNQPEPSGQLRTLQGAAVGSTSLIWRLDTANRSVEFDVSRLGDTQKFAGLSLQQGTGAVITPSADNVGMRGGFLWSERITE